MTPFLPLFPNGHHTTQTILEVVKTIRYEKEYTLTNQTFSTRNFKITMYGKELPPEIATTDTDKISKIVGIDITRVKKASIEFFDGSELFYEWEPVDGEAAKTIQGEEFVRNWHTRNHQEYVHKKYTNISYEDGKIYVYLPAVYHKHLNILYAELPENYPITDWETFSKDPWREIAPNIPIEAVKRIKTTKSRVITIEVSSTSKYFVTTLKKTKNYFIYRTVPFAEGVFEVKIPRGTDADITSAMSIHELPPQVKITPKLQIVERAAWRPMKISYERYGRAITIKIDDETEIAYSESDGELYIKRGHRGLFIKNGAALLIMEEILNHEEPLDYINTFIFSI